MTMKITKAEFENKMLEQGDFFSQEFINVLWKNYNNSKHDDFAAFLASFKKSVSR